MGRDVIRKCSWYEKALIAVFLCIIFTPLTVQVIARHSAVSHAEKRQLAQPPSFPGTMDAVNAFPKRFDQFVNDQFGLRPLLLRWNSRLRWRIGLDVNKKVLCGREGWFFLGERDDIISQYRGISRFSDSELSEWIDDITAWNAWCRDRGIHFVVVVPPNKHSIYGEMLPDSVGAPIGQTRLDQIMEIAAGDPRLPIVDLREVLRVGKKEMPVYYKTDSHWNDIGGFLAYRELVKSLAEHFPRIRPLSLEDFEIREAAKADGDLLAMLNLQGTVSETVPKLVPVFDSAVIEHHVTGPPDDGSKRRHYFTTSRRSHPVAMVFHDSFFWGMASYLKESFKRMTCIHHGGRLGCDAALIEQEKPDVVILEFVERNAGTKTYGPPVTAVFDRPQLGKKFSEHRIPRSGMPDGCVLCRDVDFGARFRLDQCTLTETEDGLSVLLSWQTLREQRLLYTTAVHLVDAKGTILSKMDYPQDRSRRIVGTNTCWNDTITIPREKLAGATAMALALYIPRSEMLTVNGGETDWGGKRLLIHLKNGY